MDTINYSLEPLLFYLRDNDLYFTSFARLQYNEYAIFIDYQEWYLSKEIPFYQYLTRIKVYKTLLQDINNHPVLIVMPTDYIENVRYYYHYFNYWTAFEHHIFRFVTKIIPDVHICPFKRHNSNVLTPLCYDIRFDISCLNQTDKDPRCKLIQEYSEFTKTQEEDDAKRLSLLMEKIRKITFIPNG